MLVLGSMLPFVGMGGGGVPPGNSPESQQFFDRLATQPDATRKALYAAVIDRLVTQGVWAKTDVLRVHAAVDSATALTNLKSALFAGTAIGNPTFLADFGFTGAPGKYIDDNFNPTTAAGNFTQNSASYSAWTTAVVAGVNGIFGYNGASPNLQLYPMYSVNNTYRAAVNCNAILSGAISSPAGYFVASRENFNLQAIYKDGILLKSAANASSALANIKTGTLQDQGFADGNWPCQAMSIGGALNASDVAHQSNALLEYMMAVVGVSAGDGFPLLGNLSTVISDGTYNAFPGLVELSDHTLAALYRTGSTHLAKDGVIKQKLSTDAGLTWSAATTVFDGVASNQPAQDVEVMRLANGNVLAAIFTTTLLTDVGTVRAIPGAVSGSVITWGSPVVVTTTGFASAFATSKPIELSNGHLLLPVYGFANLIDAFSSAAIVRSTDGGATWGSIVTTAAGSVGNSYNEANGVVLASGRIVLFIRKEGVGIYRTISDDNGATWSAAALVKAIASPGRPTVELVSGDSIFMITRDSLAGAVKTGYAISTDQGATWPALRPWGVSPANMVYASTAKIRNKSIKALIANETNQASVYFQDFVL